MIINPHFQGTKGIRMNNRLKILIACALVALVVVPTSLMAQTAPATSVFNYPGAGVICAGDVWESFLPQGTTPNYGEVGSPALGVRRFVQMGNFDRGWTTPSTHFPSAFPITPYWFKDMWALVYDPDTTWNRITILGSNNPSFFPISAGPSGSYSNFAQLTYKSTLNGVADRKYTIDPYWADGLIHTPRFPRPSDAETARDPGRHNRCFVWKAARSCPVPHRTRHDRRPRSVPHPA